MDRVTLGRDRRWEDEVVYFAMTDRFNNGSGDAGKDIHRDNPEGFHGGDWQGIINKLDDLKDLGVTTVWISPVTQNDRNFFGKDGYHGYWPHDFYHTEPNFGDLNKLKELVDKAHQKGMKVIIDLVLNHTGYNHPWVQDPTKQDWFHHGGKDRETRALFGLPDLAQENPDVSKYLIDMGKYWIRQTGADGYRLDALMHMPKTFIKQFSDAMHAEFGKNFLLVGEAYNPDPEFVASYEKDAGVDGMFDYGLSDAIRNVVGQDNKSWLPTRIYGYLQLRKEFPGEGHRVLFPGKGGTQQFHDLFLQDSAYPNARMEATLIENHDMPRFISAAGEDARQKLKLALGLEFTFRGIPTIYYGTEDAMKGMTAAEVREDKQDGADPQMREYVKTLAHMRQDNVALRRGDQKELLCDHEVYAFMRSCPQLRIVVAANVSSDEAERQIKLDHPATLRNLVTGETVKCPDGSLDLTLPAHDYAAFELLS
ncbi:MAG: alpha-amylase family glycosyl hydrolase [Candidatus Xenobia bacterium]